jgi:hypothetical protein
MQALSREQIVDAFPPRERRLIGRIPWDDVDWPSLDFCGWVHPSGRLGYIVVHTETGPRGMVLDRQAIRLAGPRRLMCSWCKTLHASGGVASFTVSVAGARHPIRLTEMACSDLACSLYLRGLRKADVPMPETLSLDARCVRLRSALADFFRRAGNPTT